MNADGSAHRRQLRSVLLTSSDAAAAAGVAQSTLREWVHRGLLMNHGTGRVALYDPAELVAAMDARKPRRTADTPRSTRIA